MNPQHIMSSTPQQGHAVSRHVFVSTQTHRFFSLVGNGKDSFLTQQVSGVGEAGADVFLFEAGVIPQNFFLAPSFGEQVQYEFNRQSRSSYDGLAGQNGAVSDDVIMPVHKRKITIFGEASSSPAIALEIVCAVNARHSGAGVLWSKRILIPAHRSPGTPRFEVQARSDEGQGSRDE